MNNCIFEKADQFFDNIPATKDAYKGKKKHNYIRWYNFYFSCIKDSNLNILEIGVDRGVSLKIWKEYFKNSNIYGIEKNTSFINKDLVKGCKIFEGDHNNIEFLKKVCKSIKGKFDIIIDDGSNIPSEQIKIFEYLFKKLNQGGIYVIENLQTSYQDKFRTKDYRSAIEFLRNKIDDINFNGKFMCNSFERIKKKSSHLTKYEKSISGISFYTGICFIFKRF